AGSGAPISRSMSAFAAWVEESGWVRPPGPGHDGAWPHVRLTPDPRLGLGELSAGDDQCGRDCEQLKSQDPRHLGAVAGKGSLERRCKAPELDNDDRGQDHDAEVQRLDDLPCATLLPSLHALDLH